MKRVGTFSTQHEQFDSMLHVNELMMMSDFYWMNMIGWILIVLAH